LENDKVYEIDGPFVANLDEFYGDAIWALFNREIGEIRLTDTLEGCKAAARPNVDAAYNN